MRFGSADALYNFTGRAGGQCLCSIFLNINILVMIAYKTAWGAYLQGSGYFFYGKNGNLSLKVAFIYQLFDR